MDELDQLKARVAALEAENAELKKSEIRLANVLEIARIGSWELDLDEKVATWSPETRLVLDVGPDVPATPETVMSIAHPEDRAIIPQALERALQEGARYNITYRMFTTSGEERTIQSLADIERDEAGRPRKLIGIVQDVTERQELRAQLLQAQKMESVGRLAAGLAHDFNNMLTVIESSASFLEEAVHGDAQALEDIQTIGDACRRAAGLTRSLLTFSRQQVLKPELTDINRLVDSLCPLIRRTLSERVDLEVKLEEGLGAVLIDPQSLAQVIINLAINSLDAMPDGGKFSVLTHEARPPSSTGLNDPMLCISLVDTVTGMDEAVQRRVFDPFFSTKGPLKGTGLGLTTAYGIVTQAGGTIQLTSALGQGTRFDIYLPFAAEAREPKSSAEELPVSSARSGPATILIVEDEAVVRNTLMRCLKGLDYKLHVAESGDDAWARFHDDDGIDLLVTDIMMPGMSGRELADHFRERHPRTRILLMSGYAGDPRLDGLAPRPDESFLPKPFRPLELRKAIADMLEEDDAA